MVVVVCGGGYLGWCTTIVVVCGSCVWWRMRTIVWLVVC